MNVSRVLFCLTILLTAPIECFVARDIVLYTLIERNDHRDHRPTSGMNLKKLIVTTALVLASAILSFSTDCLSIVLELNVTFFNNAQETLTCFIWKIGSFGSYTSRLHITGFMLFTLGPRPLEVKEQTFSTVDGCFWNRNHHLRHRDDLRQLAQ